MPVGGTGYDDAVIRILLATLWLAASSAFAAIEVLPGSSPQTGVINQPLPNPVRLRVTDGGVPVPNAWVEFVAPYMAPTWGGFASLNFTECHGSDMNMVCDAITGEDGVAQFVSLGAAFPGDYTVTVLAGQNDAAGQFERDLGSATLQFHIALRAEPPPLPLTAMWWGGSAQNGWGLSLVRHGNQQFNVLFVYDDEGQPTWYVQPAGTWSNGVGSKFSGAIFSPLSAAWFAYDAARFDARKSVGQMTLRFINSGTLSMQMNAGSRTQASVLQVQDFTGDFASPLTGVADMWWGGPTQNGWGIAIHEEFGNLFMVWLTYGSDGNPTWFVMPGGSWVDDATYAGSIYRTHGSKWLGTMYDAGKFGVDSGGTYSVRFVDSGHATFTFDFEGRQGTLPLQRQPFD